jgi:hypothetical protein
VLGQVHGRRAANEDRAAGDEDVFVPDPGDEGDGGGEIDQHDAGAVRAHALPGRLGSRERRAGDDGARDRDRGRSRHPPPAFAAAAIIAS